MILPMLLLYQCFLSVCFTAVAALQNLALNKPAWQHSTLEHYSASLAVDGNPNPDLNAESCAHTDTDFNDAFRTWAVDLQAPSWVNYVEVMRRDNIHHGMLVK